MKDTIEVQLSKTKILLLFFGAIAFVALGILMIILPEYFVTRSIQNPEIIRVIGMASAGFFGICLVFIAWKLFDHKTGLIIDQNGITDNSNATSVGLIEWEDITGIVTVQVASTKILMLETDKPEKYIERAKNRISKRVMKANHKMYGSPLSVTSNSLKVSYDDLEKLITGEFEQRKK